MSTLPKSIRYAHVLGVNGISMYSTLDVQQRASTPSSSLHSSLAILLLTFHLYFVSYILRRLFTYTLSST